MELSASEYSATYHEEFKKMVQAVVATSEPEHLLHNLLVALEPERDYRREPAWMDRLIARHRQFHAKPQADPVQADPVGASEPPASSA